MLNNEPIPWEHNYKYLGLHLDSKLTWCLHIQKTLEKANRALGALSPLLALQSCLSLKNKLLLYKSMIRPILTYGCMIFGSAAKIHIEKMQVFQNKLLRRFVQATRYIRNDVIHNDLNIKPLYHEFKKLTIKFHRDCLSNPNPALHCIGRYDPHKRSCKRPLAILARPDDFIPISKRRRFEPP